MHEEEQQQEPPAEENRQEELAENGENGYRVKLESFEGPLDLLLHLIKKNEVDINDIPISLITEQYLAYIDMMKTLNLEIAGEYLVMAATLAHIKSKSLLPEDSVADSLDDEEENSEEALKRRLLEYQRFKEAGESLQEREWLGRDVFSRDQKMEEVPSDELKPVSLFTLVELFYERIKKLPKVLQHEVVLERTSIADRIQQISSNLEARINTTLDFMELLDDAETRYDVIVTFLAVLEMVRVNLICLAQSEQFGSILVSKRTRENPHAG